METRRLLLAMALCFMVVFLHSIYAPREDVPEPPQTTPGRVSDVDNRPDRVGPNGDNLAVGADPNEAPRPDPLPSFEPSMSELVNAVLSVMVDSAGASIREVYLTQHQDDDRTRELRLIHPELGSGSAYTVELLEPMGLATTHWERVSVSDDLLQAVFRLPLPDGRGTIIKTIALDPYTYILNITVEWPQGILGSADELEYEFAGPWRIRHDKIQMSPPNYVVTAYAGPDNSLASVERLQVAEAERQRRDPGKALWSGLESNYFFAVMRPVASINPRRDLPWQLWLHQEPTSAAAADAARGDNLQAYPFQSRFRRQIEPGVAHTYEIFLGPKEKPVLAEYKGVGYDQLIDYGWAGWGWFIRLFLTLIHLIAGVIPSYGIAIICLTVMVKSILHPLNKRNQAVMQRNQKKMAKIQPQMKEIKERHKKDPMKANKEIQKLMRDNDVNPAQMFGGCLMMLLQLPIWIGLYRTFSLAIELRHKPFLYIDDLTLPDRLFGLGFELPFLGWDSFNLLPIVYVVLTLINQRMMPKSDDPNMQQQQKMMSFMMVAFGFIFYNFSSGLMLYFLTNSGLGIIEQKIIRAKLRKEDIK